MVYLLIDGLRVFTGVKRVIHKSIVDVHEINRHLIGPHDLGHSKQAITLNESLTKLETVVYLRDLYCFLYCSC